MEGVAGGASHTSCVGACGSVGVGVGLRYVKISQESVVVERRGCEYWVSLGCWSRFLLGMRA